MHECLHRQSLFSLIVLALATLAVLLDSTKATNITQKISKPPETLHILSLLPYPDTRPGFQPSWGDGHSLFLAGQLAVADINSRADILNGYIIELLEADSGCDVTGKAEIAFVENILHSGKKIVGMVGTRCSHSADIVSTLNAQLDISLINIHISHSPLLTDRARYPNSFGVLGSAEVLAEASSALMDENNWHEIAILYDHSTVSTKEVLQQKISEQAGTDIVLSSIVYDSQFPLDELRESDFQVGFVLLGPHLLQDMLCLTYHEGLLFPKYQWVILSSTVEVTNTEFLSNGKRYYCNSSEVASAIDGVIFVQYHSSAHSESLTASYTTKAILSDDNSQEVKEGSIFGIQSLAEVHYDAVWCLVLALNNSVRALAKQNITLSDYKYGNTNITSLIREQVLMLDFEGMSGRIKFENCTGYVSRLVNIYQVINGTMGLVAHYKDRLVFYEGATFIGGDDSETRIIVLYTPLYAAVLFLLLLAIALIAMVITQIMTVIYRNYKSIKATSPKLTHLAYIGCYLIIIAVVAYVLRKTFELDWESRCILYHVTNSSASFGSTLVFGVMCGKTWRLYRIFVHFRNPGRLISNPVLFLFVVFLLVFDAIVTLVWILMDPFSPKSETFTDGDTIMIRETCHSKYYFLWFGLLLTLNVLLMVCALALAVRSHQIPHKDFKTRSVILTVYLLVFILGLGFALFWVLPKDDSIADYVVLCVMFILYLYTCTFFLFLPPFIPLFKQRMRD